MHKMLLAIGLCLVLVACSGGGGGDSNTNASTDTETVALQDNTNSDTAVTGDTVSAAIQGYYRGVVSHTNGIENGFTFLWLPNGTFAGTTDDANDYVGNTVFAGTTVFTSNTDIEITIREYFINTGRMLDAKLLGTLNDGTVSLTVYQDGGETKTGSIIAARLPASQLDLNLDNIAGTYTESDGLRSYSIDGNGVLTGNDADCTYTGTATDIPSSPLFSLDLEASSCQDTALNSKYEGVVALDPNNTSNLMVVGWNESLAFKKVISR